MNSARVLTPASSPWRDQEQHSAGNRIGVWTFLATEILFFGGLFTAYIVYRHAYSGAFAAGSRHLEFLIGTANTTILLTSSLFMALAELAAKEGRREAVRWHLLATGALGIAFLGLKGHEYLSLYHENLVPGPGFDLAGPHAPQVELFLFLYFALTGLHAAHMIAGLSVISWVLVLNHRGRVTAAHHDAVAMTALYWHFVDCVWVFLYPLLYLVR